MKNKDIPQNETAKLLTTITQVEREQINKVLERARRKKCVLCGGEVVGYGHNAQPLRKGLCCDDCNNKVIAIRLMATREGEK